MSRSLPGQLTSRELPAGRQVPTRSVARRTKARRSMDGEETGSSAGAGSGSVMQAQRWLLDFGSSKVRTFQRRRQMDMGAGKTNRTDRFLNHRARLCSKTSEVSKTS